MPRPRTAILALLRLILQAVAGILATAVLTWGIVLYNPKLTPVRLPFVMTGPDGRAYLYTSMERGFGTQTWSLSAGAGNLPYPRTPTWIAVPPPDSLAYATTTAYGWPLLCMTYRHEFFDPADGPDSFAWTPPQSSWFKQPLYRFPLHILPARFAASATVLAILFGLGWPVPTLTRLIIRWRKGHCLTCGYDRRGLDRTAVCPECGVSPARARSKSK
jgi:hypothetical protein